MSIIGQEAKSERTEYHHESIRSTLSGLNDAVEKLEGLRDEIIGAGQEAVPTPLSTAVSMSNLTAVLQNTPNEITTHAGRIRSLVDDIRAALYGG